MMKACCEFIRFDYAQHTFFVKINNYSMQASPATLCLLQSEFCERISHNLQGRKDAWAYRSKRSRNCHGDKKAKQYYTLDDTGKIPVGIGGLCDMDVSVQK